MVSDLLTAGEVARILRLNPRAPYDMARDGRLPAVRLSRRAVRFRRQDVERLIAESLVHTSREDQGLPAHVEDPGVLDRIAGLVGK